MRDRSLNSSAFDYQSGMTYKIPRIFLTQNLLSMKNFSFLPWLSFFFPALLYAQYESPFICGTEGPGFSTSTSSNQYTPNGRVHTMKGELKVLIVFAAFEGTLQSANGDWHIFAGQDVPDESNNWGLPTWVEYENGEISIDKFLFDDPDDFDTNDPNSPMNDPENLSIS